MSSSSKKRESSSNLSNGDSDLKKNFKSSRLSMGGRIGDVVAVMNHTEIDKSSAVFCEHVNRADKKIFTIKNAGTSEVKHIGKEESAGDGFEYLLALVNKRTKQVEYRPVSVIQFEAKYKPAAELLTGEKAQTKQDYSQNFTRENFVADRKSLTAVFGSQKKNKALEAAARRNVTEDTLTVMTSTAFASPNIGKDVLEEKVKKDGTPDVSLLLPAESSVLPVPNRSAKHPSEVYSLDQFLNNSSLEKLGISNELESEALKFFAEFDTMEKLISNNIAKIVASRVRNITIFPNPGRRAAHAMKLVVLSRIISACIKDKGPTIINLTQIEEFKLPPHMVSAIRAEFLGVSRNIRGQMKINLTPTEKSRLIAHFLCMMLLFDEPDFTVPVSPLSVELNIGETTSIKLLQGLGCTIMQCTAEQAILYNSLRIARLTGPPEKNSLKRFKFGRK